MDRSVRLKTASNGREVFRIQGVYWYVINQNGQVGVVMGFHPLVVVTFEDTSDTDPLRGYLRVDRWVYPLARSFSPIFAWGPDRLIMPEPFSPLTQPAYVVVRLPMALSRYQKDTLWNLLDVHAHLRGKFSYPSVEELRARDKLFELSEITPYERIKLDRAQEGACPPGTHNLPGLDDPSMVHKLVAIEKGEARLSICFGNLKERKAVLSESTKVLNRQKKDLKRYAVPPVEKSLHPINGEKFNAPNFAGQRDGGTVSPGGAPELVRLPKVRGNLIRIYVLGPRDLQHIGCSTVLNWIPIPQIMLSAVNTAFKQQVRLRKEKELYGVPPSFDGRPSRWFYNWGAAEALNAFGVAKQSRTHEKGLRMDLSRTDPTYDLLVHDVITLQNLEKAAELFDCAIDECKIELLSYAPGVVDMDRSPAKLWLEPLIPRDLLVRYRKIISTFLTLMTLTATIEGDLVYKHETNYSEEIHEECEHHYPKLRPRNKPLDPKYPYPRRPPVFADL
ncbi:hypothetical protein FBUS_07489 [Fasciolopsis buskii]|uniref:Uncharacterized protein n=1 Tax=Fasciolopsis buskii TaxID=27845 RepID=A0A8E0RPJ6_9TREM|nr:hypothetical protein FBUS_07489 [Fasciolopsis buski]